MKKLIVNKVLRIFNLHIIRISDLNELKIKTHLTSGHTLSAYASFYIQNMEQAEKYCNKSEESFENLINDFEHIINQ